MKFEELLKDQLAIRRAVGAPFCESRLKILQELKEHGYRSSTLYNYLKYLIVAAKIIQSYPPSYVFDDNTIQNILQGYALKGKSTLRRSLKMLIKHLGRWRDCAQPLDEGMSKAIMNFLDDKQYLAMETKDGYKYTLYKFGRFLRNSGTNICDLNLTDVDDFILTMKNIRPITQRTAISRLINFLQFCERQNIYDKKIAKAIIRPRIWKHETIPSALPWEIIENSRTCMNNSNTPLRNKAIILLFSTYGFRSNEVRNLSLDDIDWENNIIHLYHTKTRRHDKYPLDISVGNSIIDYLLHERPKTESRILFVQCQAPFAQLSRSGLCAMIRRHFLRQCGNLNSKKGPHAIRHAVAQRLLDSNLSFKIIGDHLGHASPESTSVYAALDSQQLKKVAMPTILDLLDYAEKPSTENDVLRQHVMLLKLEDII